jgi:hypothetical protein
VTVAEIYRGLNPGDPAEDFSVPPCNYCTDEAITTCAHANTECALFALWSSLEEHPLYVKQYKEQILCKKKTLPE